MPDDKAELPFTQEGESLNEQQLRFVAEYVADPRSKADAYRRAYDVFHMPVSTASSAAVRLLKDVRIQAEVAATRAAWSKKHRVTFQTVVRKLASIALGDSGDLYESDDENAGLPKPRPWKHIPPAARKNIVTVKFKRRKLKVKDKDDDDYIYELEEFDYKVLDPMAALSKLCEYLGVTKGSLTADDLRSILTNTEPPAKVEAGATDDRPATGSGGDGTGGAEDGCDPPTVRG